MTAAQIIYEQYKVLPKRVRQELKARIISEDDSQKTLSLGEGIEESLKQVKQIQSGELPRRTFEDVKEEMSNAK